MDLSRLAGLRLLARRMTRSPMPSGRPSTWCR